MEKLYIHKSFLEPFFKKMNEKFNGQWCVLHSYETLPNFSKSDVDMAFNGNINELEKLILEVTNTTRWKLYQKLWYDSEYCFYYILKDNKNNFLALDFLIDYKGIGRYGFSTLDLLQNNMVINGYIPIPNHSISFCYKIIKRIIKKISPITDEKYLSYHYMLSNKEEVETILKKNFGKEGADIILKHAEKNDYNFSLHEINYLLKKRRQIFYKKLKIFSRIYYESKRIIYRVFHPSGLIITVPDLEKDNLLMFKRLLSEKLGILFRSIEISTKKYIQFIKASGSSLVISPLKKFDSDYIFYNNIFYPINKNRKFSIKREDFNNIEKMVNFYYNNILNILSIRIKKRV